MTVQITTRPQLLRFISPGALRAALCAAAVLAAAAPCIAEQSAALADYPVKAIRIIVASSPGTASDIFARSLGEDLGAFYGKRILVDNRPGAGDRKSTRLNSSH